MHYSLPQLLRDVNEFSRQGLPRVAFWAVINHCNAVCTTCHFYRTPKSQRTHVRLADAKKAIQVLKNSNFRWTSITGGEPLLNPDFFDICDAAVQAGLEISYVPTNGLLVDDAAARRFKAIDAKVVGISIEQIGADGMGPTRKIKRLKEVLGHAREALEAHGVRHYAGLLLSKDTLDMDRVMAFVQELGFKKIVFSYPQVEQQSSYRAARSVEAIQLSAGDVAHLVTAIKRAKKTYPDMAIYNTDAALDDFLRHARGEAPRFPCWGGKRLFYIDWQLDVYRCFTLPTRYGNLLEMGERLEIEEPEFCDQCSQQAFRDFGPMYSGAESLGEMIRQIKRGHLVAAAHVLSDPQARAAVGSLYEVVRGGFL